MFSSATGRLEWYEYQGQPVLSGPHAGKKLDRVAYDQMLDVYYQKRGWSKDGQVCAERKKELLEE